MKIILDSTCDLPEYITKKYDIEIVPVYVNFGDKSYLDRVELKPREFYELLRQGGELPTTAAPNPNDFLQKLSSFKEHSSYFVGTVASNLSATYQSAKIAVKRMKDTKIYLFDSFGGSGLLGLLAIAAAKLQRKGVEEDKILDELLEIRKKSYLVGYVDNLNNLLRSGRISRVKHFVATALNTKPILEITTSGELRPIGRARGKENAVKKLIEKVEWRAKKDTTYDLMVTHADDIETANNVAEALSNKLSINERIVNYLTPALGTHLGLGTVTATISPVQE